MKQIILTLCLALTAVAASAQYVDDMYDTTPSKPKKQKTNNYQQSEQIAQTNQTVSSNQSQNQELITSYEDALQRRLNALRNMVDMDEAYWQLLQQYQVVLEAKYDKSLYNIVVVGNDMWVEPQWITSLFDGSDPAQGVIQYNEQIKKALSAPTVRNNSSSTNSDATGGGGGSQTVIINVNVDPWYNSGWNYGWGYPYGYGYGYGYGWGAHFGWGGGWYNPWHNPWHHHYDPWYNPWYRPYYNSYYSNPRGTYYGNSATRRSTNQSGWGLGGTTRQVRGANGTPTRGYDRRIADIKPTGSNTVSGIGGRGGRGELRGRGGIPTGGVADLRSSGGSFRGMTNSGTQFERPTPTRRGTSTTIPSTTHYQPSTITNRPSRSNTTIERKNFEPRYERPIERPTRTQTTRPIERPSTYERPSTTQRSTPTYSRPSGGGGGGIVARPSRGR